MIKLRNSLIIPLFFFMMIIRFAACSYADDQSQSTNKTNVSIISEIKIFELGTKTQEMRSDWANEAQALIEKIFIEEFSKKSVAVKRLTIPKDRDSEWDEIKSLYNELSADMISRDQYPYRYPEKSDKMNYGVGSIDNILKDSGSDYILYIDGIDCVSTDGRKASKAAITALGLLVGVIRTSWGEITYLDAAIIDSDGKVVWHGFKASEIAYNLRNFDSTQKLIRELLADLDIKKLTKPAGWRSTLEK